MRRNSTHKNFIDSSFFIIFYVIYSSLCSIYLFLPPLWGCLFFYFARLFRSERYYSLIAFIVLLLAIESNKGFYPGVLCVTYALIYILLFDKITHVFKNAHALNFLYVVAVYVLYIVLYNLNAVFIGADIYAFNFMIFYYILCEIVFVLVGRWVLDIK